MRMTGAAQLKAQIKNLAHKRNADPRALFRIYMMERFLDRVSRSTYQDRFVLKGGMLISYLVGVNLRTTMDIDTTMYNLPLSASGVRDFIDETLSVDIADGVSFELLDLVDIMGEADYPGIRVHLNAEFDGTTTPVKIDISTGHAITPSAIKTSLPVMFGQSIPMLVYPTETIIAEKLQTILSRATLNTRMRDFYDLHALKHTLDTDMSSTELQAALHATMENRDSMQLAHRAPEIMESITASPTMRDSWEKYRRRYDWAQNLTWDEVLASTQALLRTALSGS